MSTPKKAALKKPYLGCKLRLSTVRKQSVYGLPGKLSCASPCICPYVLHEGGVPWKRLHVLMASSAIVVDPHKGRQECGPITLVDCIFFLPQSFDREASL